MWDLIVSVPDHCLSFYFSNQCFTLWHEKSKLLKFTFSSTEIEKVSKNELELGDKNFCGILMDWKCDKLALCLSYVVN